MSNDKCERCGGGLIEIDHWGERLTGCPKCNRWQTATGEWCLAPDDISGTPSRSSTSEIFTAPIVADWN